MSSINDLSIQQLRQAADLKEKIEALQKELSQLGGSTTDTAATSVADKAPKKKGGMSAAGRARIAAAAKARWAKVKAAKSAATTGEAVKSTAKAAAKPAKKKSGMTAAAKAKLSAAMKAAWAARKAAKK